MCSRRFPEPLPPTHMYDIPFCDVTRSKIQFWIFHMCLNSCINKERVILHLAASLELQVCTGMCVCVYMRETHNNTWLSSHVLYSSSNTPRTTERKLALFTFSQKQKTKNAASHQYVNILLNAQSTHKPFAGFCNKNKTVCEIYKVRQFL